MEPYFKDVYMKQVSVLDHPVLKHQLGRLRDETTSSSEFRILVNEMSRYLAFEATRELSTSTHTVNTPICEAKVQKVTEAPIVVSVMRAGNGMLEGVLSSLPFAKSGHIGIYRDKFIKNTVEYYFKLPDDCKGKKILLVDPLIATADTVIACVDRLKQYEVGQISILCLIAGQLGLKKLLKYHPDIMVYTLEVENEINDEGYLVPGIGDAGDRLYSTK